MFQTTNQNICAQSTYKYRIIHFLLCHVVPKCWYLSTNEFWVIWGSRQMNLENMALSKTRYYKIRWLCNHKYPY